MKLIDNTPGATVEEALRQLFAAGSSVSLITNHLSLFAWDLLREELEALGEVKWLFPVQEGFWDMPFSWSFLLDEKNDRRELDQLKAPFLASRLAQWLEDRVQVKATTAQVGGCSYCSLNPDGRPIAGLQGSSSFIMKGLLPSDEFYTNFLTEDSGEVSRLRDQFEKIWNDARTVDAKAPLLTRLRQIAQPVSPKRYYFNMLYQMFGDCQEDLDEERFVNAKTGIYESQIWKKLYRFQRDGVVGAVNKLERYNGCIIADSVGLGKTYEALAVIKYYELRNDRVLVLAPKKLRDNWTVYTSNDTRNPLAADRFNYDVLNHTDLTRFRGRSGELNLETLNWGNYDLLVIDESHNFRTGQSTRKGLTRYGRLMRDVIQAGVKTKVLMLSATPVNNRMNDLKHQVAFITEGNDNAFHDFGIPSLEANWAAITGRFQPPAPSEFGTSVARLNECLQLQKKITRMGAQIQREPQFSMQVRLSRRLEQLNQQLHRLQAQP